ncbi:MAG: hypothetical protein HKP02_07815 [Xanthomonadales bacterium]|nr:hypothetical protein [Xanthomonadales bacterium]
MNRLPPPGWDDKYRHVMPQYDMLHDADGRLLVDFVGRFESLQEDFRRVCAKLGIESAELPHRNRSDKKSRDTRRKLHNWLYSNGDNRLGLTRGVAWADNQRIITLGNLSRNRVPTPRGRATPVVPRPCLKSA